MAARFVDNFKCPHCKNNCEYFKNLIYLFNNCFIESVQWSLDRRYLKIHYPRFAKEHLSSDPMKCDVVSFIKKMDHCGFVRMQDFYETNPHILLFKKVDVCNDYALECNNIAFEDEEQYFSRNTSTVNVPRKCDHHQDYSRLNDDELFYLPFYKSFEGRFEYKTSKRGSRALATSLKKKTNRRPKRFTNYQAAYPRQKRQRKKTESKSHCRAPEKTNSADKENNREQISETTNSRLENDSEYILELFYVESDSDDDIFMTKESKHVMLPVVDELSNTSDDKCVSNDYGIEKLLMPAINPGDDTDVNEGEKSSGNELLN